MSYREKQRKSPLKEKPLHNPGESIQAEMERLFEEVIMPRIFFAGFVIILALYDWIRYYSKANIHPSFLSIIAIGILIYVIFRTKNDIFYYRCLKKGLDGEKFVGQYLEDLRSQDCRVFHDITCGNFNIDHVIVAPQGVFVIETKTFSKPMRGSPVVEFDGKEVMVDKMKPYRNSVEQVIALKDWLHDFLVETTGNKYPVRGIVIFPGWYVVKTGNDNKGDIKVMNHKNFSSFLSKCPIILKKEDIALISSRIANYVRTQE